MHDLVTHQHIALHNAGLFHTVSNMLHRGMFPSVQHIEDTCVIVFLTALAIGWSLGKLSTEMKYQKKMTEMTQPMIITNNYESERPKEPPDPPRPPKRARTPDSKGTRTVLCQAPTTYKYWYAQPRFEALHSTNAHGAWVEP